MTRAEEVRELVLEGAGVELIPKAEGGYILRIGVSDYVVEGRSAAECFLNLADILSAPIPEGRAQQ